MKVHSKKVVYIVVGIIILLLLYALKNTSYFTRTAGFIFAILLFFIGNEFFKFNFKLHHHLILIAIAAFGILFSPLYFMYPSYDKILHFLSPILVSILIFYLVNKLDISFSKKLLITISLVISAITLFEVVEFTLDKLFDLKLQGVFIRDMTGVAKLNIIMDPIDDTMIDLILGIIGALVFAGSKTIIFAYKRYILKKNVISSNK
jgi:hypothetical protein